MELEQRILAFSQLGKVLKKPASGLNKGIVNDALQSFREVSDKFHVYNPWFTPENIVFAIDAIGQMLDEQALRKWTAGYPLLNKQASVQQKVGVIMAGNIPMVGFHDFLCVLMSDHIFFGKPSPKDDQLLKSLADILIAIEPAFNERILWAESRFQGIDSVIATGSNNSSRYFEYYFGKYPHIIRKNRNSIAILSGHEIKYDLAALSDDMLRYFGLGCRNVSKIYVPAGYNFASLFEAVEKHSYLLQHNKYLNNYEYNRAIYLVNRVAHLDNGFFILKEDKSLASPVSVVYFEHYTELAKLTNELAALLDEIQCIVSAMDLPFPVVPLGRSQEPGLNDYADGIDTMEFLLSLDTGTTHQTAS